MTTSVPTCGRTSMRCVRPPRGTGRRSRSRVTRSRVPRSADARSARVGTSRRSTAATSSTRCGSRIGTASSRARGSRLRAPSSARPPTCSRVARPWFRGSRSSSGSSLRASRSPRSARDRRHEALLEAAELLDRDPDTARGRPSSVDAQVERALDDREAGALDALAETYDQAVPEPDAAARFRRLAGTSGPIVGYLGKLIPQKGVELMLQAHRSARPRGARAGGRVRLVSRVARRARHRARARRRPGARVAARGPRDPDRVRARSRGRGRVLET